MILNRFVNSWKKIIIGLVIVILSILVVRSVYSVPQIQTEPAPSVPPSPIATIQPSASPSPKITEIDTRDPKAAEQLNDYFKEYCKNNDCSTPKPTPAQTPKPTPNNLSFCYVEKNGSFYMTSEDCQKLHDADPDYFRKKSYENCKDGKNPEVKSDGDQRKADCSKLFGLNY